MHFLRTVNASDNRNSLGAATVNLLILYILSTATSGKPRGGNQTGQERPFQQVIASDGEGRCRSGASLASLVRHGSVPWRSPRQLRHPRRPSGTIHRGKAEPRLQSESRSTSARCPIHR